MINAVIAIPRELPASAQNVNRVGLEVHVQAELAIASNSGLLAHHFVDGIHKVDRATQTLPCASVILAFSSAWVTASNVVRTDSRALS